ncbi:MAG TPA: LolA-related protein [Steroidobacteraceae bacterium]|nr:LolA-related protein [Steroidobacteraceae bacterium]
MLTVSNPAHSLGLEELETKLVRKPPVVTAFVDYRFSHVLRSAVRSSGTLEYRADEALVRTVTSPFREQAEVVGDEVRIRRGERPERRVSLQRIPQLRVLLGSFRAMLDGHVSQLSQDFNVALAEQPTGWALTLRPLDTRLARYLARIEVHGSADRPHCLEVVEPDGDVTLTFLEVPPDERISARPALESLCRGETPEKTGRER